MNDTPPSTGDSAAQPRGRTGALLDKEHAMRAVLVQLLQDIVQAETCLDRSQAAQLLEANERLIVSALGAQTEAETAHGALDEAARAGQLDPLTGLPNRTLLLDRFESAIASAKRRGHRVALLFLDLDGFKQINDTLGHSSGDQALQLVADCLTSLVRESDTVSRHGGDEFLILLSEVAHAGDAAHVAAKVNATLGAQARINGRSVNLVTSIGISVYPDDGDDARTLIDRADAAMYRAKKEGRGGYVFHSHRPAETVVAAAESTAGSRPPLSWHEPPSIEQDQRNIQLREANEALVLAALGAQELLAAAELAKARQSELLAMVAKELSDPFAPIRVAAATLGMSDAESSLLKRVQEVVEEQASRMSRKVGEVLALNNANADSDADSDADEKNHRLK